MALTNPPNLESLHGVGMVRRQLMDLDDTICELKKEISNDPDPFLFDSLNRLLIQRKHLRLFHLENGKRSF